MFLQPRLQDLLMDEATSHAIWFFICASGVSAFAGLSALLRFKTQLTLLNIFAAMLNSGLLGLSIAMYWYEKFLHDGNIFALAAICALVGLGGSSVTDAVLFMFKKGGIHVTIAPQEDQDKKNPPPGQQT